MKLQQLNGTYYPEEDRILLRIKTSENAEYRLWLTRLILKKILDVIEKISQKHIFDSNKNKTLSTQTVETIDEMQQKKIQAETDLTEPYQPAATLPLGSEPKIISEIKFLIINPNIIKLRVTVKNDQLIEFDLNTYTLSKIRILLNELNKKASWGLNQIDNINNEKLSMPHSIH